MAVTYKSICDKLGFDPASYKFYLKGYEDDSRESPLAPLSYEELNFLCEYLINNKETAQQ